MRPGSAKRCERDQGAEDLGITLIENVEARGRVASSPGRREAVQVAAQTQVPEDVPRRQDREQRSSEAVAARLRAERWPGRTPRSCRAAREDGPVARRLGCAGADDGLRA